MQEVILLSRQDVELLNISWHDVLRAVTQAVVEHGLGQYEMESKIGVHPTNNGNYDNFIHAMPAYLPRMGICGMKWVAGYPPNHAKGLPNVSGVYIHNCPHTGAPLAIMDASYLTGLRTAAVSLLAAHLCAARMKGIVISILGCGFQGKMHADFFLEGFPELSELRVISPRNRDLTDYVSQFQTKRVRARSFYSDWYADTDILITATCGERQYIEHGWMKPSCTAIGIEGGCAFTAAALKEADRFVVDDRIQAEYFDKISRNRRKPNGDPDPEFPGGMPEIHATLGEILTCKKDGRSNYNERIIVTPIGMAVADVAVADLIYRDAKRTSATKWKIA